MKPFWDSLIAPMFLRLEPRTVIEIGAFRGDTTALVLDYCREHGAVLHVIDPIPQFDVGAWQTECGDHFVFHHAKSLDVLRSIEPADIVLIDGDHNWYTVYHELKQLAEVARQHQCAFPVVLFHDVGWPYARRDLYYEPDDIPAVYRRNYKKSGILPGRSPLHPYGINDVLFNAVREGGPRNGVLTAIEDFIRQSDEPMKLILIDGFWGLGVLYPDSLAERSPALNAHLAGLAAGLELLGGHIRALDERFTTVIVRWARQRNKQARAAEVAETQEPPAVPGDGGIRA